jgi:CRP-like cAMP-binding protein
MDAMRFASLAKQLPLSAEQLVQIAPYASERVIPAGRRLLLGGPFARELVLVAGGRGVVRCAGETVAQLGPGDVFGELAPQRPLYDTASVTAHTELRLVVLSARAMKELRAAVPEAVDALVAA